MTRLLDVRESNLQEQIKTCDAGYACAPTPFHRLLICLYRADRDVHCPALM